MAVPRAAFGRTPPIRPPRACLIWQVLNEEEMQVQVVPTIVKLFANPDRAMRIPLLERLPALVPHFNTKVRPLPTASATPHQPPSSATLISHPHQPPSSVTLISHPHQPPSPATLISHPHQPPSVATLISHPPNSPH